MKFQYPLTVFLTVRYFDQMPGRPQIEGRRSCTSRKKVQLLNVDIGNLDKILRQFTI